MSLAGTTSNIVISTEGGVLCRRSGETCMLQSAMQMFVARFASRPEACLYRHDRLRGQPTGLSTAHCMKPQCFGRDDNGWGEHAEGSAQNRPTTSACGSASRDSP